MIEAAATCTMFAADQQLIAGVMGQRAGYRLNKTDKTRTFIVVAK